MGDSESRCSSVQPGSPTFGQTSKISEEAESSTSTPSPRQQYSFHLANFFPGKTKEPKLSILEKKKLALQNKLQSQRKQEEDKISTFFEKYNKVSDERLKNTLNELVVQQKTNDAQFEVESKLLDLDAIEKQRNYEKLTKIEEEKIKQLHEGEAAKNTQELEKLREEGKKNKAEFDSSQLEYTENELKKEEDHQQKVKEQEEHLRKVKEDFERKLEEIREETIENMLKWRQIWEEKEKQLEEQFRIIMRNMALRIWTNRIENNWTNRLNFLRSANREVERNYANFSRAVYSLKTNEQSTEYNKNVVKLRANNLVLAITSEQNTMEKESENMQKLFEDTGKQFLKHIKMSVDEVAQNCSNLVGAVVDFLEKLSQSTNYNNIPDEFSEVKRFFDVLRSSSLEIPTLALLKELNEEETKQESTWNSSDDDSTSEQTVVIEEIE